MLIDDNKIDLYIAQRVINKSSFAEEVILMDSAKEAISYFELNGNDTENLPCLIFLDINMPEMNGFEFLEAYHTLPENIKRNCIIMMLTTSVHAEDKDKADNNPYIRNYLNKPLSEAQLSTLKVGLHEADLELAKKQNCIYCYP